MKKYLDTKTRIKAKWYFPAFGFVIALERKRWWGWRTTSWIYPEIMTRRGDGLEKTIDWLKWDEEYNKNGLQAARKLMNGTSK